MAEDPNKIHQRGVDAALYLIEGGSPAEVAGQLDLKQLSLQLGRSANLLERKIGSSETPDSFLLNVHGALKLMQSAALKPEVGLDEILREENVNNILKTTEQNSDQHVSVAKAEAEILDTLSQITLDHHDDVMRKNPTDAWKDPETEEIISSGAELSFQALTQLVPRVEREAPLEYNRRLRSYIEIARQKLIHGTSSRVI